MSNGPTRETAARQLAQIVGEFVRSHGHNMPDAYIRELAESILQGSEYTYYTPDSSTLSLISYEPRPDGPDFQPIYSFCRYGTGGELNRELYELLPIDLISAILDPTVAAIRVIMSALAAWYRELFKIALPDHVQEYLPKGLRKGIPYFWHGQGYGIVVTPPDVNGYVVRITQESSRRSEALGHYTVYPVMRQMSLYATERVISALCAANLEYPHPFAPLDPGDTTDTAELVGMIIRWWFKQEFTLVSYPEGEHAGFVATLREGNGAILPINSAMISNHRIVVGPPDTDGNIARLEAGFSIDLWKPVLYGTECINLALEQTLGRETLLGLFTRV